MDDTPLFNLRKFAQESVDYKRDDGPPPGMTAKVDQLRAEALDLVKDADLFIVIAAKANDDPDEEMDMSFVQCNDATLGHLLQFLANAVVLQGRAANDVVKGIPPAAQAYYVTLLQALIRGE